MNITLNIDEEIVKKVRKVAIDKDTTLTDLDESFERLSRDIGPRKWSREDLYVR